MEILNRLPLTLFFVAYMGWVAWHYMDKENDPANPIAMKKTQIQAAKSTLEATKNKLRETDEFLRSLESKRAELQVIAKQLADMKMSISEGVDTAAFVKTVVGEAGKVGLRIKSLKPGNKRDQEFYSEQSFDLAFSGAYVQVIVFLDRIVSGSSIVRAENIKIKRLGSSVASIVEVEGTMQLKTYRYLGTHADDVAKKSAESVPISAPQRETAPAPAQPQSNTNAAPQAPSAPATTPGASAGSDSPAAAQPKAGGQP